MSEGSGSGWIYYVDESYDKSLFCVTGLGLKVSTWRKAFEATREYRRELRASDSVLLRSEIHATELVRGKGRLGPTTIGKWRRSRVFFELLELTASLPDVHLINVCLKQADYADPQPVAWDRLLNRINRTCVERNRQENAKRRGLITEIEKALPSSTATEIERRLIPYSANAFLIVDRGREAEIIRLRRKLAVANFVPSKFGAWSDAPTKNIPLTEIVEDPLFRDSAHSYLIQLADCAAYALLKRETKPLPWVLKYNIHKAWDEHLKGIAFLAAAANDPDGVVRK